MVTELKVGALPGIAALSTTTARQIGSGQVLVDPSSVVKELIDNALDARAKSIFVDLAANTIDTIQVKDDGHGIAAEDRALVCRRYCTSKIRDFHDLKEVGGKWLGFRGEALSSLAEMSGMLSVTTRVEGEPVAVKLKYGRNGELISTKRDSHPIGTTVRVTNFFEHLPVRKQTSVKSSGRWLAKIRHLVQAYALARPAVRLRLHIIKAKNNKDDFVYAPNAKASVKDTVLRVIGKDCALQCDWTAIESDGFEIHAFLPKPTANRSKIANYGAFVSVDARPMSSSRKTVKQVVFAVKDRLRKSNSSLAIVKNPFFCMNIICPPESYDVNVEPAKDDVLFEVESVVIGAVGKLLTSYYPTVIADMGSSEPPASAQQPLYSELGAPMACDQEPISVYEDPSIRWSEEPSQDQPQWRSNMYGIDEDDLEALQENQPLQIVEEDGIRAAAVSNPWTIARMNAPIKLKRSTLNEQLLSPAKSQAEASPVSSSPIPASTPCRTPLLESLTPQTSSRTNKIPSSVNEEPESSIQCLPWRSREGYLDSFGISEATMSQDEASSSLPPSGAGDSTYLVQRDFHSPRLEPSGTSRSGSMVQEAPPLASFTPRRDQRKRQGHSKKSSAPPVQVSNDRWFGQPMQGAGPSRPPRKQRGANNQNVPLFTSEIPFDAERPALAAAERLTCKKVHSKNNADIRDFLRRIRAPLKHASGIPSQGSSSTPINSRSLSTESGSQVSRHGNRRDSLLPREGQRGAPSGGQTRATSVGPQPRSRQFEDGPLLHFDCGASAEPHDMAAQFEEYIERESTVRADEPRVAPAPKPVNNTLRLRRRTTDGLQCTRSSKLSLERVPHGYQTQDVVLPYATSLVTIVQSSRKIDMSRNNSEWGYAAVDAFDVFSEPIMESKIMTWVFKLDEMLYEQYERRERVDTRCELHEGIRRGLDARKEQGRGRDVTEDIVEISGPVPNDNEIKMIDEEVTPSHVQQSTVEAPIQAVDEMSDFDMSQFVDLDADVSVATMGEVDSIGRVPAAEEFGDDIEDDMLMDL